MLSPLIRIKAEPHGGEIMVEEAIAQPSKPHSGRHYGDGYNPIISHIIVLLISDRHNCQYQDFTCSELKIKDGVGKNTG